MIYKIKIYNEKNGKSEIEEYIRKLRNSNVKEDKIKLNKIRAYLNLLSERGLTLREPYVKKINREIWELRPLKNRILFASVYKNEFILLSCFEKSTKKTPLNELKKAQKNLLDYQKRREKNE